MKGFRNASKERNANSGTFQSKVVVPRGRQPALAASPAVLFVTGKRQKVRKGTCKCERTVLVAHIITR